MCPIETISSHVKSFIKLCCIKKYKNKCKESKINALQKRGCSLFYKIKSLFIPKVYDYMIIVVYSIDILILVV